MPIIGAFMVPHPPLIIPSIGKGEEKKVQKTIDAYYKVAKKIKELNPLNGVFVNLSYPMPNGNNIKLLDDNDILATIGMGVDDLKLIDEVINNETK